MERPILKPLLSKLCAVPLLYRTEHFLRGEKRVKGAEKKGRRGAASEGSKKEKRTDENRSIVVVVVVAVFHLCCTLSGSHRSTHIASDLVSWALSSQAKPQGKSKLTVFPIARKNTPMFHIASQHLVTYHCDPPIPL